MQNICALKRTLNVRSELSILYVNVLIKQREFIKRYLHLNDSLESLKGSISIQFYISITMYLSGFDSLTGEVDFFPRGLAHN